MQANSNIPLLLSILSSLGFDSIANDIASAVSGNSTGNVTKPIFIWDININMKTGESTFRNVIGNSNLGADLKNQAALADKVYFIGGITTTPDDPSNPTTLTLSLEGIDTARILSHQSYVQMNEVVLDAVHGNSNATFINYVGSILLLM